MSDEAEPTRLFLITPPSVDLNTFPAALAEALVAGDVAAVLIAIEAQALEPVATALVPVIQQAGAAAIIAEDTRLVGRLGADGVHVIAGLQDLRMAVQSLRPKRIVGVGNVASRHDAMEAGEIGPDYILFGRPHGDTHDEPHPKALDLAEWWAEVASIPAVAMAGRSIGSVATAAATGASFVGLHAAVWTHPAGPAEAVREAHCL